MNLNDDIKKVLITKEQIEERCQEIAKELDAKYDGKTPVILSLLRGSVPFANKLTEYMSIPLEYDYMRASSYRGGVVSCGNVAVSLMPATNLEGRNVIIVEDIIDTGTTLSTVKKIIEELKPASIEIVTLLDKPEMRKVNDVTPEYVGFVIPNEFVVGFGLDYKELYRQLPYVGVLKEKVYSK